MSVRLGRALFALAMVTICCCIAHAQNSETMTGSGIVVSGTGDILTNAHVVENCETITVQLPTAGAETAVLAAQDKANDLAVVHIKSTPPAVGSFREGTPVRLGDQVIVLGYPLAGVLASSANLSVGNVSALAGLQDDSRFLQISAPVQPGNSGGPLLDASGHLVGIVTSKLNAMDLARYTGDMAQNVNFAIKAEVAKAFLDSRGFRFGTARSDQQMPVADIADVAKPFTVFIECRRSASARNDAAAASSDAGQSDSLESRVADFVAALFAVWSGPNSDVLPTFKDVYADSVMYYGKRLSAQDVLADKQSFIVRWPERDYKIVPGSVSVDCNDRTSACTVKGLLEWRAASDTRLSSGRSRFEYVIKIGARPAITSENGAVVKRYSPQ